MDLGWFNVNFANANLISKASAETLRAFPLFVCNGIVTLGMEDPLDFKAVDQLRGIFKAEVAPVVCEPRGRIPCAGRAHRMALRSLAVGEWRRRRGRTI